MDEELDRGSTPPMGHPPTGQNSRGLNSAGLTSADQTSAGLTSADQISAGANPDDIATADEMSDGSAEQNPHNRMSVDQDLRDWNTGLASAAPEGAAPFTSNLDGTAGSADGTAPGPSSGSDGSDSGFGAGADAGAGAGAGAGGAGAGSGGSSRRVGPQPAWRDPSELPGVQRVLTGSFGQKLAAITDAARTVQAVMASIDADTLSDPEIIALTQAVEQAGRPVDAARVRAATVVSHRSNRFLGRDSLAWRLGASRDLDLLTRLTRTSDAEMKRRVELGERVCPRMSTMGAREPVFPIVAAALAAGELGVEAAANIVKALADYTVHGRLYADPAQVSFAEAALVEHATGSRYGRPTTDTGADGDAGAGADTDGDAGADTDGAAGAGADTDGDADTDLDGDADADLDGDGARDGDSGVGSAARSGPVCRLGDSDLVAVGADHIQAMTPAWQAFLNPDGAAPKEATREAKSSFSFGKLRDGLYPLRGSVTPDLKGVMQNLFNTYQSARTAVKFPSAQDQQRIEAGELVPGELLDERTGGEKRADILRGILTQVAQDPRTPSMGGMPPTVMVHVNATDLLKGSGVGWIDGVEGPISMTTINQMIDNGGMQPIFFNGNGAVLGLGSTARCFTPLQRKAITARDGGCIIPGCTCPPQWCEVHHVEPWQYGGKTHVNNGVLLCWYHHHTITSSTGWKIRMVHGIPHVKAPHWVDPTGKWRTPDTHRAHDPQTRKPPD